MSKPKAEIVYDVNSDEFKAYVEARTEIQRLRPFIVLDAKVERLEALYQSLYFPSLERL